MDEFHNYMALHLRPLIFIFTAMRITNMLT